MAIQTEDLTPEQVAVYLRVRKETVYRYIREGKLLAIRPGRHYLIPRENLDLFLHANSTKAEISDSLFNRVIELASRNRDIPLDEVEKDVSEAVAFARRAGRG